MLRIEQNEMYLRICLRFNILELNHILLSVFIIVLSSIVVLIQNGKLFRFAIITFSERHDRIFLQGS